MKRYAIVLAAIAATLSSCAQNTIEVNTTTEEGTVIQGQWDSDSIAIK